MRRALSILALCSTVWGKISCGTLYILQNAGETNSLLKAVQNRIASQVASIEELKRCLDKPQEIRLDVLKILQASRSSTERIYELLRAP